MQIKAKGVAPRSKVVPSNGVGRSWREILEYSRKHTMFTGKQKFAQIQKRELNLCTNQTDNQREKCAQVQKHIIKPFRAEMKLQIGIPQNKG